MHIFLTILAYTLISIVYTASRIGYKNPSTGFRKYAEWVICPPAFVIMYVVGKSVWLLTPARMPIVIDGTWADLQIHDKPKKYHTQIRLQGEKGKSYTIDLSSNDQMITEIYRDNECIHRTETT